MELRLYNSVAEVNVLNKSSYLTLVTTLTGTLREGTDLINPTIRVELATLPTFNYVHIPEFNRYYFVQGITSVRNKIWDITLHVDVLMTYRTQILSLTAEVDRNEFDFDLLIEDGLRGFESNYDLQIVEPIDAEMRFDIPTNIDEIYDDKRFTMSILRG